MKTESMNHRHHFGHGRRGRLGRLALVVCTLGLVTFAGCRKHSPEDRADWVANKLADKLELNDAQKQKLDALKVAVVTEMKNHRAKRDANRDKLKEFILADRLDESKVREALRTHQEEWEKVVDRVFPKLAEFHESLTPEQKAKAVELMEKFHGKRHGF